MRDRINKKAVLRAIACLLFLLLAWQMFLHLTYLFRNTRWDRATISAFQSVEENTIDVVFIGGSNIYRYWDPFQAYYEQGIASYNYSTSGMPAATAIAAIKDVRKTQEPKLFVVDARKFLTTYWDAEVNASFRNVVDSQNLSFDRLAAVDYFRRLNGLSITETLSSYIDLIYYHSNADALASGRNWLFSGNRIDPMRFGDFYGSAYMAYGFAPLDSHYYVDRLDLGYTVSEKRPLLGESETCLRDLLTYCGDKGIPLLLVSTPFVMTEQDAMELNAVGEIAGEYGVSFLDMNLCREDIGLLLRTDFYDKDHVNVLGSEKFTSYLAAYLSQNWGLPDRRGDNSFDQYAQLYDLYWPTVEQMKTDVTALIQAKDQTIENESVMRGTTDAAQWFSLANDENLMLLISMPRPLENAPSPQAALTLGALGMPQDVLNGAAFYIGVYAAELQYMSTDDPFYSQYIDTMSRTELDDVSYTISAQGAPEITVNGINYFSGNEKGIHIVAMDKNTNEIADAVIIDVAETGELTLTRS